MLLTDVTKSQGKFQYFSFIFVEYKIPTWCNPVQPQVSREQTRGCKPRGVDGDFGSLTDDEFLERTAAEVDLLQDDSISEREAEYDLIFAEASKLHVDHMTSDGGHMTLADHVTSGGGRVTLADHVTSDGGHVTLAEDHVTSDGGHMTLADHVTSGGGRVTLADHVTSDGGHVTLAEDHVTSGGGRGNLAGDHVTSDGGHVTLDESCVVQENDHMTQEMNAELSTNTDQLDAIFEEAYSQYDTSMQLFHTQVCDVQETITESKISAYQISEGSGVMCHEGDDFNMSVTELESFASVALIDSQ